MEWNVKQHTILLIIFFTTFGRCLYQTNCCISSTSTNFMDPILNWDDILSTYNLLEPPSSTCRCYAILRHKIRCDGMGFTHSQRFWPPCLYMWRQPTLARVTREQRQVGNNTMHVHEQHESDSQFNAKKHAKVFIIHSRKRWTWLG